MIRGTASTSRFDLMFVVIRYSIPHIPFVPLPSLHTSTDQSDSPHMRKETYQTTPYAPSPMTLCTAYCSGSLNGRSAGGVLGGLGEVDVVPFRACDIVTAAFAIDQ